ncbi:MAG: SH3 domain-containing protein [Lachnospiraceae bacterium]|nr:SH3 domain-containing protein [Lachnospiraceae bacterium]
MRDEYGGDFRDFLSEHYQYFAVGVLFVILIVVLVIFNFTRDGGSSKAKADDESETEVSTEDTGTVEGSDEIPVPDVALEQNMHEEVNAFFTQYYTAMAEGDIDQVASMWSNLDDENRIRFETKASFTESYDSMSCYTKPGPVENSYIVFVYYEIKFNNIDTRAPGLSTFYVCTNGDGQLYIQDMSTIPDNQKEYITAIANQDDVQELLEEVDTLYTNNISSDPTLDAFMKSLQIRTDDAVAQAKNNPSGGGDAASGEGGESGETSGGGVGEVRVTTTDTVNVRAAADQGSEKLGTAAKGDTFVRIAEEGEWSKVKYKDGEAYIKSEFLTTANTDTGAEGGATATDNGGGEAAGGGGKITVNDTGVNVRSGPGTDSDTIGKAENGKEYELLGEENGWYKINFNGSTGYIRNDFATKN